MISPIRRISNGPRHVVRLVVAAICVATAALVIASIATARVGSASNDPVTVLGESLAALSSMAVGAILVNRLPHHVVAWLLLAGGLLLAAAEGTSGLADFGLNVQPGAFPGAVWSAWVSQMLWAPEIAGLLILLPLVYPTGRPPSARWRPAVAVAAGLLIIGVVTSAVIVWVPDPYPVANPLGITGTAADVAAFLSNVVATSLVFVGIGLALGSVVIRYRGATRVERQQIRWFATAASITGGAAIINIGAYTAAGFGTPSGMLADVIEVSGAAIYFGAALIPIAVGLAILRYRLYDLDRLVSRTITWALVTSALLVIFGAAILTLQDILSPLTQGSTVAVAASTLLVAALFQPLRRRLQAAVDRRFDRAHLDATRAAATFADRLRDEVDLARIRGATVAAVADSVAPAFETLWLRGTPGPVEATDRVG